MVMMRRGCADGRTDTLCLYLGFEHLDE